MHNFPTTQYTEHHGAQIAFQVIGEGPVDVLHCSGLASNCDHNWDVSGTEAILQRLSGYVRLILFDRRGTGHSDPLPAGTLPTWEDWSDDVLAVMDAAGSRRAVVHGERDGGVMALLFAATHPDRTQALSLGNATARYLSADDYRCGVSPESANQIVTFLREKWGTDEFTLTHTPGLQKSPQDVYMSSRRLRGAATPRQAAAHFRYFCDIDVRSILPTIRVPTLVSNCVNQTLFPIEQGRYLADHIPNAKFLELPGHDAAVLMTGDTPQFHEALMELATGAQIDEGPQRALATVLFCDIVDSTKLAGKLGDRGWHELLQRFYAVVRGEIARHAGKEVDTAGDGFFITFDRPTQSIACACAIRDAVKVLHIQIRCGIHTGECSTSGGKVTGMAVHVGARITAAAQPDEVWASETVKALTLGSGINFSPRGEHELKGVPDLWSLHAVVG